MCRYSPCTGTNHCGRTRLSMNFSSSWDAWPDTCTGGRALVEDLGAGAVQRVDDA